MGTAPHRVSISIDGKQIDGWTDYEVSSSLVDPVDHFSLTRPFDAAAYRLCQLDAEVTVRIDDTAIVTGYIDDRDKDTSRTTNTMQIVGRDKVGRLVQESAPTVSYDGLDFVKVATLLASPWFGAVTLSDARNRTVRLGKRGRKAAAAGEALVVKVRKKTWQVEPGQMRWKIINDLASEAGYLVWSAADGKELVIGKPNYAQASQFVIANPSNGGEGTALAMKFHESIADRYSMIMALGSGRGDAAIYGAQTVTRRDIVRNGPGIDGTGVDFVRPKRLILADRTLLNIEEARQFCQREMDRRDFGKQLVTVTMPGHGQTLAAGVPPTLFAPNTIARVIDMEQDLPVDAPYMIFGCKFAGTRDAETTELQLVPSGTVFVQ